VLIKYPKNIYVLILFFFSTFKWYLL